MASTKAQRAAAHKRATKKGAESRAAKAASKRAAEKNKADAKAKKNAAARAKRAAAKAAADKKAAALADKNKQPLDTGSVLAGTQNPTLARVSQIELVQQSQQAVINKLGAHLPALMHLVQKPPQPQTTAAPNQMRQGPPDPTPAGAPKDVSAAFLSMFQKVVTGSYTPEDAAGHFVSGLTAKIAKGQIPTAAELLALARHTQGLSLGSKKIVPASVNDLVLLVTTLRDAIVANASFDGARLTAHKQCASLMSDVLEWTDIYGVSFGTQIFDLQAHQTNSKGTSIDHVDLAARQRIIAAHAAKTKTAQPTRPRTGGSSAAKSYAHSSSDQCCWSYAGMSGRKRYSCKNATYEDAKGRKRCTRGLHAINE